MLCSLWKKSQWIRPPDWRCYLEMAQKFTGHPHLTSVAKLSVSYVYLVSLYLSLIWSTFIALRGHLELSFLSLCLCLFLFSRSQSPLLARFFYQFICLPLFLFSRFFKISHVPVKHFQQKTNFIKNQRLYFPFSFLSFYCNIFSGKWKEKRFFCSFPQLSVMWFNKKRLIAVKRHDFLFVYDIKWSFQRL